MHGNLCYLYANLLVYTKLLLRVVFLACSHGNTHVKQSMADFSSHKFSYKVRKTWFTRDK